MIQIQDNKSNVQGNQKTIQHKNVSENAGCTQPSANSDLRKTTETDASKKRLGKQHNKGWVA